MFTSLASLMTARQVASRWRADPPQPRAHWLHVATHFESGAEALRRAFGHPARVAVWEYGELGQPPCASPGPGAPVLFVVSRPDTALRALVEGADSLLEQLHFGDYDRACDYYVARLHALRELGCALGRAALFVDGHRTCDGEFPQRLALRLGWKVSGTPPDRPEAAGVADRRSLPASHVPARVTAESAAAYERCRSVLARECLAIA